jgi:DNA-binding transcriptional MerR regulator
MASSSPVSEVASDGPADEQYTIDELARRSGMTARNIRAYQAQRLLPPPAVRGRTGYYGEEHLARLRMVAEMRGRGLTLRGIRGVLADVDAAEVLDIGQAMLGSVAVEEPEVIDLADLAEHFGADPSVLARAEKLRVIVPLGGGRWEVPSPTLLRAGEEMVALGVPAEHLLAVLETVQRHTKAIAQAFLRLVKQDLLGSSGLGDHTTEELRNFRETLERLPPLAHGAVRAALSQNLTRVVEQEIARALRR